MSEAERSLMKGRMLEGMRNKARRGALLNHPPMGYVRGLDGDDQLDPGGFCISPRRGIFQQYDPLTKTNASI